MLGVSRKTLRKWTTRGLFHASHVGDRIYYERDEVEWVKWMFGCSDVRMFGCSDV